MSANKALVSIIAVTALASGVFIDVQLSGHSFTDAPTAKPLASDSWKPGSALKASTVVADLMSAGICKQIPDTSNWDGTEYGHLLHKDVAGQCLTYAGDNPVSSRCDSYIYVTTGAEAMNSDPERSLGYEDSMSVGLVYGTNWQIEISPVHGAEDDIDVTLANCKGKPERLQQWAGGNLTKFGQYN
ncbi:MAG: hypothetical protein RJA35_539 [Actinomycetota bacterium]|jgi:hypothetical protein